jgi:hypothetical protein
MTDTFDAILERIEKEISPFEGYKKSLAQLAKLPPGYALCFSFHHVNADISNGGISQLYGNSTWPLIHMAQRAAEFSGSKQLAFLLKQIIFYYHRKGRSRLKRELSTTYFESIDSNWDRTLSELEDEYFSLEQERESLVKRLISENPLLFTSEKT